MKQSLSQSDFLENNEIHADFIIALAGNPNTGKSTVFNALTGLKQHTGNWPGKTVVKATGYYEYKGKTFMLVDLPGTYSLLANSPDEEISRDFICFGEPDATVVVVDATSLERNLNLVLQVLEIAPKTVICLNLMDEAKRLGITIQTSILAKELGVPTIPTIARSQIGLENLQEAIYHLVNCNGKTNPHRIRYSDEIESLISQAEKQLDFVSLGINKRWLALRLIDGDPTINQIIIQQKEEYCEGLDP